MNFSTLLRFVTPQGFAIRAHHDLMTPLDRPAVSMVLRAVYIPQVKFQCNKYYSE